MSLFKRKGTYTAAEVADVLERMCQRELRPAIASLQQQYHGLVKNPNLDADMKHQLAITCSNKVDQARSAHAIVMDIADRFRKGVLK